MSNGVLHGAEINVNLKMPCIDFVVKMRYFHWAAIDCVKSLLPDKLLCCIIYRKLCILIISRWQIVNGAIEFLP